MLTHQQISDRLERILLTVQKPGRYVGGEINQVVKDWDAVETRIALAFPDIYDIGLSNLGLAIFYEDLNARPDVLAERTYAPWTDMEAAMRSAQIPLYTLESKHALADFDILAFTLPYESIYTNALNMLDLAGLPLFTKDRNETHPLVIAGGHASLNPEPMHAFIDAFAVGEGEEIFGEIVDAWQAWKKSGQDRATLLLQLAQIPGIYVPSLYHTTYAADGTIESFALLHPDAPAVIQKRIVGKLPPPPTRPIVPSINTVQNRVAVEIMRGCARGCRFCHAGMVNRPVRERPVEEILHAITASLENSGFEEVALLSLSSSDYTHILDLIRQISEQYKDENLRISLPSLRIESLSIDLFEMLRGQGSGGFTLAPEAATEHMRNIINKPIQTQQLLDVAGEIYSRGWTTIKLYFMIGHPSETLEDVQAIAELCKQVIAEGHKAMGRKSKLNVGVSTFVPKPHTPFQWVSCDTVEQMREKQHYLRDALKVPGIKFNWSNPNETIFEAMLSRGDRRTADAIYHAWQHGAKFDSWREYFNHETWQSAFAAHGLTSEFFTNRERSLDEPLPWDHIHTGVHKSFLAEEYKRSHSGTLTTYCREQCHACGILRDFRDLRAQNPGDDWKCPEVRSIVTDQTVSVQVEAAQ